MSITVQRTKTEPIPAGLYAATIEKLEEAEGKFGPQLKATFLLDEAGFEGKTLTGWASLTFSPKSKLWAWVRSAVFGGRDLPESYQTFDSDHLIGRRVFLSVSTEKGTDGEAYNRVKDVLPFRRAQPVAAQPTATPAPRVPVNVAQASEPAEPPAWLTDDDAGDGIPL